MMNASVDVEVGHVLELLDMWVTSVGPGMLWVTPCVWQVSDVGLATMWRRSGGLFLWCSDVAHIWRCCVFVGELMCVAVM